MSDSEIIDKATESVKHFPFKAVGYEVHIPVLEEVCATEIVNSPVHNMPVTLVTFRQQNFVDHDARKSWYEWKFVKITN